MQSLINMMTLDKDAGKRPPADELRELKDMKKNGKSSGSENNDSISYLGDEDEEEVVRQEKNSKFESLRNKAQKLKE